MRMEKILKQNQYPFSFGISPYVEETHERILTWISDFGLLPTAASIQRYQDEKYVWWAGRTFPFADKTGFLLVASWTALFFIADDMMVDTGNPNKEKTLESLKRDVMDILVHNRSIPMTAQNNFGACFSDLWYRIKQHTEQDWQQWFIEETINMLKSWQMETELVNSGNGISLENYIKMRPYFSGGNVCCCLLSLACKYNFPFFTYKLDAVQQMLLMAIRTASWANDIHSLGKELDKEGAENMVLIFMRERGLSFAEALQETLIIHNSDLAHLLELEHSLPSLNTEIDEELRKYVKSIKALISGNHEWVLYDTYRYKDTIALMEKWVL